MVHKKWQTKSYLLNDFINIQLFKMKINLYCQKFNPWFFREEATTMRHEESFGGRRVNVHYLDCSGCFTGINLCLDFWNKSFNYLQFFNVIIY